MKQTSIHTSHLKTICWVDDCIIDFASAGKKYSLNGEVNQLYKYTFGFGDAAISSSDGQYVFIYQKLGTKGLLLKNGEILREINRSYYYAEVYEYPSAFVTIENRTFLIHCPIKYCRLDFEDVETGEIITNLPDRNPIDFFHSRLEISPNGKYLMSKGWFWHPWDSIRIYNIQECINFPKELDKSEIYPEVGTEICTASFIDDNKVLIGASDEEELNDELLDVLPQKHIAIWDIALNKIANPIKVNAQFGNLFAINERYAWDLYEYPKIIDLKTGEIVDKLEPFASGSQNSSIIGNLQNLPKIAFNQKTKQIAITQNDSIEIFEP